MKHSAIALALIGAATARPAPFMLAKREVPQEHSHENILIEVNKALQLNNPNEIQDAVFGLLGAEAAAKGAGKIADADCLQLATADQAFTNAKAAKDVTAMTNALIYRALERNTGKVGLASVACKSIKAVNPEIAALQQHQDPAGDGAQALNKQIAEELARQIAGIGGDAQLALEASTFAPGDVNDATGAGNTCDDAKDVAGCINSQKLRVDDLKAAEIEAAVANVTGAANATGNAADQAAKDQAAKDQAAKDQAAKDKEGKQAKDKDAKQAKHAKMAKDKNADKVKQAKDKQAAKDQATADAAATAAMHDNKNQAADAAAAMKDNKNQAAADAAAMKDNKNQAADAAAAAKDNKNQAADAAAMEHAQAAAAAAAAHPMV